MRDAVAFLRNRAEDERLAGNEELSNNFGACADEIERLRASEEHLRAVIRSMERLSPLPDASGSTR